MGPQQLLADAFRSVNLDSPTALRLRAEAPSSRFDDYLDEAGAPPEGASASDASDRAEDPRDDARTESEAQAGDARGESEAAVAAEGASAAASHSQALQVLAPQAQVSIGTEAAEEGRSARGVDSTTAAPRAGGDAVSSARAPTAHAGAGDAGEDRITHQRTAAPVVEISKTVAVESRESTEARDPVSSQQRTVSLARPNAEVSKGQDGRAAEGPRAGDGRPTTASDSESVKIAAVDSKQGGVEGVDLQSQTLHQRKVEAWLAERREGPTENKDTNRNENGNAGDRTLSAKLRTLSLENVDAPRRLKPGVRAGHGDGPAAAVARFLVVGAGKVDAAVAADIGSPPVGRPSPTGSAAPAATNNIVGDLLTARVEGTDSIEGAARFLASAGSQGRHQVTMQLDPPELGQLRLVIRMQQQNMSLRVEAQTQSVVKLLESRLGDLREALATQGIRVDRADIVVRSPESGETNGHTQREPGQGPSGQAASDDRGADFLGDDRAHTSSDEAEREAGSGAGEDGSALSNAESVDRESAVNEERTPATESSVDWVA